MFKPISTDKAPKPVGPYSQAFKAGPFLFCSGQIPLDPKGLKVVGESIEEQARQVFENLKAVLAKENLSFKHVVKTLIFLTDLGDFPKVNQLYESYFREHRPARSCVEVSALPLSVKLEMELIAFYPPSTEN